MIKILDLLKKTNKTPDTFLSGIYFLFDYTKEKIAPKASLGNISLICYRHSEQAN